MAMRTRGVSQWDDLDDFDRDSFTFEGSTKDVFRKGSGPGVVVITEIPGITPYVADFARRVVDDGFTVAMPDIIGTPGKPPGMAYMAQSGIQACISREFQVWAANASSPIIVWLRALARDLHERCGGPGVGAIGMCLTGNFALAMSVDDELLAPVLSQPSLPLGGLNRSGMHISPEDLQTVKRRTQQDGLEVIGLRFRQDPLCAKSKFDRLERELGDAFIRVELENADANPRGRPIPPHSVLTTDCIDEPGQKTQQALEQVLDLFHRKLDGAAA